MLSGLVNRIQTSTHQHSMALLERSWPSLLFLSWNPTESTGAPIPFAAKSILEMPRNSHTNERTRSKVPDNLPPGPTQLACEARGRAKPDQG